jgi:hypothetical protein
LYRPMQKIKTSHTWPVWQKKIKIDPSPHNHVTKAEGILHTEE